MLVNGVKSVKINSDYVPFINTVIDVVENEDKSETVFLDLYVHKTIEEIYDELDSIVNLEITLNNGMLIYGKFHNDGSGGGCLAFSGDKAEIHGAEVITPTPFEIWEKQLEQNERLFDNLERGETLQAELIDYADEVSLDKIISFLLQHDIVKDEFNKKLLQRINDSDYVNDSIKQYVTKQVIYFLEDIAEKLRKEERKL
jgi:hypothetical protein